MTWRAVAAIAMIRAQRQDPEGAIPLLREACPGLEAAGDLREAGWRWMGLANLLLWRGDRDGADAAFDRAERCAAGFPGLLADVLRSRAKVVRQRGDLPGTRALLERALAVAEATNKLMRARVHNDLGDLARAEGDLGEARRHLQASLALRRTTDTAVTRLNLAMIELDAGDPGQARAQVREILSWEENPWYRVFAHGVGLAAAEEPDDLDHHLAALELGTATMPIVEKDLLDLMSRSVPRWAAREPDRAARIAALANHQAVALDADREETARVLRELREEGAAVPLGPLALRREVAAGGMGQVWRGEVRGAGFDVAVKVLSPERARDPQTRATLWRELRAVAALDHPGIVPLIDHGAVHAAADAMTGGRLADGSPWLATRWAHQGTLADWCGRRTFEDIRLALAQLLEALGAAHARGLLHLDVKPNNVLVEAEPPALRTWLADFGVARALGADADQPVAGTPAYMAPEQCRGATRQYGPWTDLYAVGGVAVALVQGAPPFQGSSQELLQQQVSRPIPPLRPVTPVPPGFEDWCRRLLAKAPQERFRCAADAAAALLRLPAAPDGPLQPSPVTDLPSSSSSTFVLDGLEDLEEPAAFDLEPAPVTAEVPAESPTLEIRAAPPAALATAASRLVLLRPVPLVGRDRERQALWQALQAAEDGAHGVYLDGDEGAGRTHLLRWLAEAAARTGAARVLWIGDGEGDPWRRALAELLHADGLSLDALEAQLPRLLEVHVGGDGLGETERGLLARVLAGVEAIDPVPMVLRLVAELARERTVIVALATGDTSGVTFFLERLLGALASSPVLAVVPRAIEGARLPDRIERVRLDRVEPEGVRRLVDALVPLDPALRDRLVDAVQGDTAAAVWAVRRWLGENHLRVGPRGLVLPKDDDQAMPTSSAQALHLLLESVVAPIRGSRRRVALAAVLGDGLSREAWAAACQADGVGWSESLAEALLARGLLRERGAALRFGSSGVRRAVLDATEPAEAASAHRIAAGLARDEGTHGLHLMAADAPDEALAPLRRAMFRAVRTNDRLARTWLMAWQRARAAAGLPDDDPEVVRGRAVAALVDPPGPEHLDRCRALLEGARALDEPDVLALAHLGLSAALRAGLDVEGAAREAVAAAEAAEAAESEAVRRLALQHAGRACLVVQRNDEAVAFLRRAVAAGDATARSYMVARLVAVDALQEAARWAEVERPSREGGSWLDTVQRLTLSAGIAERLGRDALARLRLSEALALAPAVGPTAQLAAGANAMAFHLRRGERDRVAEILRGLERLEAQPPFLITMQALYGAGDAPAAERLAAAAEAVRAFRWGVDRDEVAELVELAVGEARWADHADAIRALAAVVRAGGADPAG